MLLTVTVALFWGVAGFDGRVESGGGGAEDRSEMGDQPMEFQISKPTAATLNPIWR